MEESAKLYSRLYSKLDGKVALPSPEREFFFYNSDQAAFTKQIYLSSHTEV